MCFSITQKHCSTARPDAAATHKEKFTVKIGL